MIEPECRPQPWPIGPSLDPTKSSEVVYVCGSCWEQSVNDPDFVDYLRRVVKEWLAMNATLAAYRSDHANVL